MSNQTGRKRSRFLDRQFLHQGSRNANHCIAWDEADYFKLCSPEDDANFSAGIIHPDLIYRIVDTDNIIETYDGKQLIRYMKFLAGSLFIPHVLARITFLKLERMDDANFSN